MKLLLPLPRFRRHLLACSLALVVAAPLQAAPTVQSEEPLPNQELTQETLEGLLVGEMALYSGDLELAAVRYVDMARKTRDPRVARRALEIARLARKPELVLEAARQWHGSSPRSAEAAETYGAFLMLTRQSSQGLEVFKQLIKDHPERAPLIFNQINSWLERGLLENTPRLPLVEKLAADFPKLPESHYALAVAALNDNQQERGLSEIELALKTRSKWAEAALVKGGLLQLKNADAALQWILAWQKQHGTHALTNGYLARLYWNQGKLKEARSTFEQQIRLNTSDSYAPYAAGFIAREQKDYKAAVGFLETAQQRGFRDEDALRYYLGDSLAENKQLNEALKTLDQVGSGEWGYRALRRATQLRVRNGRADEALQKLQAARTRTDSTDPWQIEAEVHRDARRFDEALKTLDEGLQRHPEDDTLLYSRAMVYDRLGKYAQAEADLRVLLKRTPDDATTLNALGYMLADRTDRLEEARELIEKAHALKPDDPFILDSLGWVYVRLGRLEQGLGNLQKAYASQNDPEIAAHLVENLWLLGRKDEARKLWQGASQSHPDHEALKNVRRNVLDR